MKDLNMDPQQQAALDAKLKKAYDNVMGIKTSQVPPSPPPPPAIPVVPQEPVMSPPTPPPPPFIQSSPTPKPINMAYNPPAPIPQESLIAPIVTPVFVASAVTPPPTPSPQPYFQPDPIPEPTVLANNTNSIPTQNINTQGKKLSLRWILVVLLIVGFLLGYAIFWIKVFGVKLPILSNFF